MKKHFNNPNFQSYKKVLKIKYYGKLIAVAILAIVVLAMPFILSNIDILKSVTVPTPTQEIVSTILMIGYVCVGVCLLPYYFVGVRDDARESYKHDIERYKKH